MTTRAMLVVPRIATAVDSVALEVRCCCHPERLIGHIQWPRRADGPLVEIAEVVIQELASAEAWTPDGPVCPVDNTTRLFVLSVHEFWHEGSRCPAIKKPHDLTPELLALLPGFTPA